MQTCYLFCFIFACFGVHVAAAFVVIINGCRNPLSQTHWLLVFTHFCRWLFIVVSMLWKTEISTKIKSFEDELQFDICQAFIEFMWMEFLLIFITVISIYVWLSIECSREWNLTQQNIQHLMNCSINSLREPCTGCAAPYGFYNAMSLSGDTSTFSVSFITVFRSFFFFVFFFDYNKTSGFTQI